ncbi:MAG TPA: c-type cytochrome [Pyrinomonadaceae bacterium]
MKRSKKVLLTGMTAAYLCAAAFVAGTGGLIEKRTSAQAIATPTPVPTTASFDQTAAIAKLKEQIKGRENEPADKVFKNIQTPFIRSINAGRLLAVMEFGYARSLGVNCTHCHTPEKWEAEDKPQKQIARDMAAMMARINSELLKDVKNLKSAMPTINCTTCHRGEIKPALNMPSR